MTMQRHHFKALRYYERTTMRYAIGYRTSRGCTPEVAPCRRCVYEARIMLIQHAPPPPSTGPALARCERCGLYYFYL